MKKLILVLGILTLNACGKNPSIIAYDNLCVDAFSNADQLASQLVIGTTTKAEADVLFQTTKFDTTTPADDTGSFWKYYQIHNASDYVNNVCGNYELQFDANNLLVSYTKTEGYKLTE